MKSSLAIVYATVFLDLVGFGIIIPIMPFLARTYGASGMWVGALMTAYSLAQFLGAPIAGRLSDRFGRRPVLLLTLLGSSASFLAMGFAGTLAVLLASRLLAGFFGGSIAAAQAYIADVTKPEERSKYMGLLGASIGMGFVLGPAIGGFLAPYGAHVAAFAASGLCFANFLFAVVRLKESRVGEAKDKPSVRLSLAPVMAAIGRPVITPILAASFLLTIALVAMEATYALLAADRYQLDSRGLGYVFTFIGVVIVIVQGGVIGRLVKKQGELKPALLGGVLMALPLLVLPFMPSLAASVAVLGVLSVGHALASPTTAAMLSRATAADEQGGMMGLYQSAAALARAVGPIVAGALYDNAVFAPYVAAGAAGLAAVLCLSRLVPEAQFGAPAAKSAA